MSNCIEMESSDGAGTHILPTQRLSCNWQPTLREIACFGDKFMNMLRN